MQTAERVRTTERLEEILAGDGSPVVLFKHSTRCPVSRCALGEFERFLAALEPGRARVAIVYVVEERAVSKRVAARLGVRHESPQALVVGGGEVLWHDSHEGVTAAALGEAVERAEKRPRS